uniref:Uncharacterized protein n=1 Tax=Cucumis melo TaxID=3656 RepID=A0A9I9DJ43_CUCME
MTQLIPVPPAPARARTRPFGLGPVLQRPAQRPSQPTSLFTARVRDPPPDDLRTDPVSTRASFGPGPVRASLAQASREAHFV